MTGKPADTVADPEQVASLAAYDDALAAGEPPPADAAVDDAIVLQLLDKLRPSHSPDPPFCDPSSSDARYVLRGLSAESGVGQVWLAYDTELDREVALKTLRPDRAGDRTLTDRFLFEARVTGRLQHPGVVPVYELVAEVGTDKDQPPFYTMRFVQGRTLTEAIRAYHARRRDGLASPVERATLLNAFVNVCHTVAYAHARGIIHRDLKPDNVVLGDYGEVIVVDWGLATQIQGVEGGRQTAGDNDVPSRSADRHALPAVQGQTGAIVGSPAYTTLEQADDSSDRVDERTDVYGLGAILYELLTGQTPFRSDEIGEALRRQRAEPLPRPRAVVPTVPAALDAVCLKALAPDPQQRYVGATALAQEVQNWLADEPLDAYPEPAAARVWRWVRRRPGLAAGSAALVVTGLFATGLGQVLLRQEQARAAEDRAETARVHAHSLGLAQARQGVQLYLHRIALAERTLAAHNPSRAIGLLDECPTDQRNWEWHCLNRLCRTSSAPLRGHDGTVQSVAFSPDGRTLASAGFDRSVRLWDVATGRPRGDLPGLAGVVYDVAFSPDGRLLASACWDGTVRVWDVATGKPVHTLDWRDDRVHVEFVTFDPTGRTLYTLSDDRTVRAWDVPTGRLLHSHSPAWQPWSLDVSPDGRLLAVGTATDHTVRLLDSATWAEVQVLQGHRHPVRAVAFSPDGRQIASGDGDIGRGDAGEVRVWSRRGGTYREQFRLHGHTEAVLRVAFANGTRLASAGQDQTVKIWDLVTGQEALTLHAHTDVVRSVAFSPDGLRLASAGADRLIRLWDSSPWEETRPAYERASLAAHAGRALGVAFHPDGRTLATVGADKMLFVWDPDRPEPTRAVPLAQFRDATARNARLDYFTVAYSPDGRQVVTADSAATLFVLDAEGRLVRTMPGHGGGPVRGLVYRPGGRQLASASWDRTVRVWDMDTGQTRLTLRGHTEPVNGVAYNPGGRWLASVSNDQTVRIWDADTGEALRVLHRHTGGVLGVAVSPDGRRLASAGNDGTVRLWDTETWQARAELHGHTAGVRAVAFSPNGERLASAGNDWTVRLWRVGDGQEVAVFRGHTDRVHGLAFNPDGRILASAGYDGAVKLWDVAGLDD